MVTQAHFCLFDWVLFCEIWNRKWLNTLNINRDPCVSSIHRPNVPNPCWLLKQRYNFTFMGSSYSCWQFFSKCNDITITVSLPAPFLRSCLCFTMDMSQGCLSSVQLCVYSLWGQHGLLWAVTFLPIRNEKLVSSREFLPGNKLLLETSYCRFHVQ